ncbi:MAG: ABC transporter ATP-binding protein [Deltaproteobacteria bacterium]|nr:MAG: ABC transporter ATP-binding protein [Deltaproteobacteria bacterium]
MPRLLLEARGVHAFYGQSHVLHGVDLSIAPGETVTLMGRNGMGKTTTIRTLLGLLPARSGQVLVRGEDVSGWPAHRIARLGIGLVPEGRGIFPTLTVRENLVVAARAGPWTYDRALTLFPRLRKRLDHLGSQISGGEQQMLSIGRALLTNPSLLILDGATEGLSPLVRAEIWTAVKTLRSEGTAALVVDKEVRKLLELGDRHLIIVKGRIVFAGTSDSFRARYEENLALLRA